MDGKLISDEESLQEVFENEEGTDIDAEAELDFADNHILGHEEGHIYESIEDEVGPAADEAANEYIPPDDPELFDDDLPESFYANL